MSPQFIFTINKCGGSFEKESWSFWYIESLKSSDSLFDKSTQISHAQLAGAKEHTNCISVEG